MKLKEAFEFNEMIQAGGPGSGPHPGDGKGMDTVKVAKSHGYKNTGLGDKNSQLHVRTEKNGAHHHLRTFSNGTWEHSSFKKAEQWEGGKSTAGYTAKQLDMRLKQIHGGGPGSGPHAGGSKNMLHDTLTQHGFKQDPVSTVYERTGKMGPKGRNTHYVHVGDDGASWNYHRKGELSKGSNARTHKFGFGNSSLDSHLWQQKDLH
jgi:hypothetical protein